MTTPQPMGKLRTKSVIKITTPSGGSMDLELKAGTTVDVLVLEMLRLIPADNKDARERILKRLKGSAI